MIIRAIDGNRDWYFGKSMQNYRRAQQAIEQNLKSRLLLFLKDAFWDENSGIDWVRLLGARSQENEIVVNCRATILQTEGVVKINSLEIVYSQTGRTITMTYNVDTIYTRRYSGTLTV